MSSLRGSCGGSQVPPINACCSRRHLINSSNCSLRRAAQHLHTHIVRLRVATPPALPERQAFAHATPKQPVRSRMFVVSHIYLLLYQQQTKGYRAGIPEHIRGAPRARNDTCPPRRSPRRGRAALRFVPPVARSLSREGWVGETRGRRGFF